MTKRSGESTYWGSDEEFADMRRDDERQAEYGDAPSLEEIEEVLRRDSVWTNEAERINEVIKERFGNAAKRAAAPYRNRDNWTARAMADTAEAAWNIAVFDLKMAFIVEFCGELLNHLYVVEEDGGKGGAQLTH